MDKPSVLYHASPKHDLIFILEPRAETIRNSEEGKVVFATPELAYSCCFLNKNDSTWIQHGRYGKGNPFYCVINDEERFRSTDIGGIIYTLPNTTFFYDNTFGTGYMEWLSREPVIPLAHTEYDSALDAMMQNEVQVFFVTKEVYEKIMDAQDYGLAILQSLQSENQKQKIYPKPLLIDF